MIWKSLKKENKILDKESNLNDNFQKTSSRTVDEFIKDSAMKEFYMNTIDTLLKDYQPGHPSNKPDVLAQMVEIEIERKKLLQQNNGQGQIVITQDGKETILTNEQIVQIIQSQQQQLQNFDKILQEKDCLIKQLICELHNYKK